MIYGSTRNKINNTATPLFDQFSTYSEEKFANADVVLSRYLAERCDKYQDYEEDEGSVNIKPNGKHTSNHGIKRIIISIIVRILNRDIYCP